MCASPRTTHPQGNRRSRISISSSLAALKSDFNRAADETRLIVLLAPT